MTDLITMLGELIATNLIIFYWIFTLLIAGIVSLNAKKKMSVMLVGVVLLAAGVFLLILYRTYPLISPQPYIFEFTGVMIIVGICFCFGFIIDAVMKYTRGREKISEETPVERMSSRVQPEQKVSPKVERAAGRRVVDLEERLGVLRGEIRRLIGYHTEDLKDEIGKISDMIKGGYWVQAGDALATLEGKVMDRKTEKDRYDQFIARVNEWVKERPDLFVD
ncbi:MAG: hypothetical protein L6408_08755, partial [Nanoarchaeota archaeon]|nr:hypothetical protein [Nanoarchaeota archaeon]